MTIWGIAQRSVVAQEVTLNSGRTVEVLSFRSRTIKTMQKLSNWPVGGTHLKNTSKGLVHFLNPIKAE